MKEVEAGKGNHLVGKRSYQCRWWPQGGDLLKRASTSLSHRFGGLSSILSPPYAQSTVSSP